MTAEDFAAWWAFNRSAGNGKLHAERPCEDCPIPFATEMAAAGRCNGEPGPRPDPKAA